MGIVKIRHQGAWNTNHERRNSRISEVDDKVEEEGLILEKDSDDTWDTSELAEVDCELAMVGDQICNIPYELYGLSNLNEILSLETWNSCFTEEERFYLAAHLPDMDQDTFQLTMKELLGGYNLFFGSPLEKFFHGLKGGFYSLQVTCIRNSLQLLHKRRYYHSLGLYHESMARRFTDMKRMWSNCKPNSTMEERIQIWNNRRDQKPVLLVDLNALPTDEDTIPLLKKTKYTNEGLKRDPHAIDLNNVAMNTMTKGKGLLKVRSFEVSSTRTLIPQPFSGEIRESGRRPPKGVLKIKPKIDTFGQVERPMTTPIPPCYDSKWHEENVLPKMPFFYQDSMPGDEKDLVFPITYKRKKGYTKLNPTDPLRQPSMVMKLKSVETSRADYHSTEKAKSVKIKVKGCSDYNAQYKRGLLNGSPST